ncbi:hypothetical protein ONZ45_g16569 [Pleurotus djamor]|nr:hypothetical protein ONZ45_g16569 [Pleurotus djamor]
MDLVFMYPTANIWLVGHSLGGSLASLLGATYGYPAVAFEAPGERLAASRLHIPLPPPLPDHHSNISLRTAPLPVTHVYHTADPIPQGACTGPFSACAQGGYALETRCHLGKSIVYDSVNVLGWRVDVRKHIIREVIEGVIGYEGGWPERNDDDEPEEDIREFGWFHWLKRGWWGRGDKDKDKDKDKPKPPPMLDVPRAEEEVDCQDCYKWEFGPFKDVPDSPDTPEDS